jgi:hypothetical protein
MEEYTHEQMLAVQEFAKGLRGCFLEKMKDDVNRIFMNYALQVLDIHLSLAELKFERYANNMAVAHGK